MWLILDIFINVNVVHMDATLLIFQMFCPNLLICVHLIHR